MTGSFRHVPSNVWIVLAVYNGQRFLREQIESLRRQSFTTWRLLVRDDGSTDDSLALLRHSARADERIEVLPSTERLGAVASFSTLLETVRTRGADYVFLCDQDDVWHPEKLGEQLTLFSAAEVASAPHTPLLLHSDLAVVDEGLRPLHASFLRFQRIWHEPIEPLRTLLVQNFVTGNTCLANRALLEAALPIPPRAVMHDWWLALCAAALGSIHFLPKTTVLYRQHGHNAVGAKGFWASVNPLRKSWRLFSSAGVREFCRVLAQAQALRQHLRCIAAAPPSLELVEHFCRLFDERLPRLQRARRLRALKVGRQERLRNALLLSRLVLTPSRHFAIFAEG